MTTLSDFFKKETVRSAPSGKEAASPRAHKFRRGVMTALLFASSVAAPSLSQAFAQQQPRKIVIRQPIENVTCKTPQGETLTYRIYNGYQDSTHVARIREAVDAAMKTPTGASVLKPFMQKKGIISMRHGMGNTLGSYMASNNEIRLNAEARGSSLKSTIVHEGTHAKQKAAGYSLERDMNAASIFRVGRALEADACTHQIFAASEMAAQGDSAVWKDVALSKPLMAEAFVQARNAGKDNAGIARETMLSYYRESACMDVYDKTYAGIVEGSSYVDADNADVRVQKDVTPAEIAAKLCTFRGKPYLGAEGGALLSDSLRNGVSEAIYEKLTAASAEHADCLKALPSVKARNDVSYRSFHVRKNDGTYRAPEAAFQTAALNRALQARSGK